MEIKPGVVQEIMAAFNWEPRSDDPTAAIIVDESLAVGSGRAVHETEPRQIRLHPRPDRPFPWSTVRHEMMHILLKARIPPQPSDTGRVLPVADDYQSQTFRENLEEYVVRYLNARLVSRDLGADWLSDQIQREKSKGFTLMPRVAAFFDEWLMKKLPFSRQTFDELAARLE